jgi:hypothetical protein
MICKNEEDRTIIELPYTEENLEIYKQELFEKEGIKANISIVVDKEDLFQGGEYDTNDIDWDMNDKSITIPYRYFYYIARIISTGEVPEPTEQKKSVGFIDFLKNTPIHMNFLKLRKQEPSVSYFGVNKETEKTPLYEPIIQTILEPSKKEEVPEEEPEEAEQEEEEPEEAEPEEAEQEEAEPEEAEPEEEEKKEISTIIPDFLKTKLFEKKEKKKIVIEILKSEEEDLCNIREIKKYKYIYEIKLLKLEEVNNNNTRKEKKVKREERM